MPERLDKPARDDLVAIQGLRWFAASLVVWVHSQHELVKLASRTHRPLHFSHLVEWGVGVDIFFLISGFLIFLVSCDLFARRGASRDFLIRRAVRILPLYWLATASMLAATLAVPSLLNHGVLHARETIASFLMLAWPDGQGGAFPLLASGWTLNLEAYFYVLFAIALVFPRRRAIPGLLGALALSVAADQLWRGSPWWLDFYAQPIVLEFGAGLLLSVLYRRGLRLPLKVAFGGIAAAIALHLGLRATCHPPRILGNGLPAVLLFASCVFGTGVALPRAIARVVRLGGDASYALYLTSPFSINATVELLTRRDVDRVGVLLVASSVVSLAVAVAVHLGVERPLTRLCRKALRRRPAPTRRPAALGATATAITP